MDCVISISYTKNTPITAEVGLKEKSLSRVFAFHISKTSGKSQKQRWAVINEPTIREIVMKRSRFLVVFNRNGPAVKVMCRDLNCYMVTLNEGQYLIMGFSSVGSLANRH